MATNEQVDFVLSELTKAHPSEFFKIMDETNAGIGFVLRLLFETHSSLTAGDISEKMHVSTARVAILIKKMVLKGLVSKETSPNDARITIVKLTEKGESLIHNMIESSRSTISNAIDKIGMDKMMEFISLSNDIRNAIRDSLSASHGELEYLK